MKNKFYALKNSQYGKANKQQGVVLVTSLVFLVALTAVAAALMQNTTTDMKMSGASEEKVVAIQTAISAVDEIINNQLNIQPISVFAQGLNNVPLYTSAELLPVTTKTGASASASVINNPLFVELPCPHSRPGDGMSTDEISCHYLQLNVQRLYGRNNTSNIVINANIAQQLLGNL